MKRFLIQIGKYSLLILLIANCISFGGNYFLKKSSFFKPSYVLKKFEKDDEIDFVIIGSSRGLTSIETNFLGEITNSTGFNLSLDDTGLPSHLIMIEHFFESGFLAKKCILVLDQDHFISSEVELNDNDYRFGPFAERDYFKEYFQERETGLLKPLTYIPFFPMLAYSYYNTELMVSAIISATKPDYRHRFDEFGDYSYPSTKNQGAEEIEKNSFYEVKTSITNPLIQELANYLQERGCELILYIAPYQNQQIVIENQIDFPLINHSNIIDEPQYFYDEIHVNEEGKKIATLILGESLKKL